MAFVGLDADGGSEIWSVLVKERVSRDVELREVEIPSEGGNGTSLAASNEKRSPDAELDADGGSGISRAVLDENAFSDMELVTEGGRGIS